MTIKQKIEEERELFREEYKKAYEGIFTEDVLQEGNTWFEDFLTASNKRVLEAYTNDLVDEIEKAGRGAYGNAIYHWTLSDWTKFIKAKLREAID